MAISNKMSILGTKKAVMAYNGGYYLPSVSDEGILSWYPTVEGMAPIPEVNVRGPQGIKGETGDKGERGYSAYEVATQNGFSGSEAEWLESLKTDAAAYSIPFAEEAAERVADEVAKETISIAEGAAINAMEHKEAAIDAQKYAEVAALNAIKRIENDNLAEAAAFNALNAKEGCLEAMEVAQTAAVHVIEAMKEFQGGEIVLTSVSSDSEYTTKFYICGKGTDLANEYHEGNAFIGYTVCDNEETIIHSGTCSMQNLFSENVNVFQPNIETE